MPVGPGMRARERDYWAGARWNLACSMVRQPREDDFRRAAAAEAGEIVGQIVTLDTRGLA